MELKRKNDLNLNRKISDQNLLRVQSYKNKALMKKQNEIFLKSIDTEENIQRIERIRELKKQKLLEKIERDNIKSKMIQYRIYFLFF